LEHVIVDFHAQPRVVPQRSVPIPDDVPVFHVILIATKNTKIHRKSFVSMPNGISCAFSRQKITIRLRDG
jgi:hypothetical protein